MLTWTTVRIFLAASLLGLASPASAATPIQVKRGNLEIKVKITGTVVPDDLFRIKATIEGRVEGVLASTNAWCDADQPLAVLAHKELAAILDSKGAQNADILEKRWQRLYRPTVARCPEKSFLLTNFLKPKAWIKSESVMFVAAKTLKLVARVRPEDVLWIRDGQELIYWPVKDPKRRLKDRVARLVLDAPSEKDAPGATFTLIMSPDRSFDPGTEWEGLIIPLTRKNVLYVPTGALIRNGPDVYLPVLVSTGITTQGLTEISAGVEKKRDVLVLDDSQLLGAERYKQEVDLETLRRQARDRQGKEAASPEIGPAPVKNPGKHATVIDSTDYGEDPYAEPQ